MIHQLAALAVGEWAGDLLDPDAFLYRRLRELEHSLGRCLILQPREPWVVLVERAWYLYLSLLTMGRSKSTGHTQLLRKQPVNLVARGCDVFNKHK